MPSLTAMTDRYPMDVEQEGMAPMVMRISAANLYDYLTGSWPARHGWRRHAAAHRRPVTASSASSSRFREKKPTAGHRKDGRRLAFVDTGISAAFKCVVEKQSLYDGTENAPGHCQEGQEADHFSDAAVAVLDPFVLLQPIHHEESSL